ncbi:MAG: response regulator [bacterium]
MVDKSLDILVVEDNAVERLLICNILKDHGDNVFTSDNGKNALHMINEKNFDLIITDMQMPFVNGLEVVKYVKQHKPRIEVIVLTGVGSIENAVAAMSLGARDYLQKPISQNIILSKLETLYEIKGLNNSVEDLYQAKIFIEEDARKTIVRLETMINSYSILVNSIKEIVSQDNMDTAIQINAIKEKLTSFFSHKFSHEIE